MTTTGSPNAYDQVAEILKDLRPRSKQASTKHAAPISEPEGHTGSGTTHPIGDADDNLIDARTGARAAENERDVKDNRESPTVDATSEATPGQGSGAQDKRQLNIGTNQSATGEDPSVEDDYKGTKEDPGTTHPMKADDGQKYAALRALPLDQLYAKTAELGDAILADIAVSNGHPKAATAPPPQPARGTMADGAALLSAVDGDTQHKYAAAHDLLLHTVREADESANAVIRYLVAVQQKAAAADDAVEGEDHSMPGDAASGAGDMGGMMGGPTDGGAGGGDAGMPPGMMGGMPPGGGGMPPGGELPPGLGEATAGMGGPPEPGPGPEEAIQELAAGLVEMGIDPMALAEAMQQVAAGGPGGAPMPGAEPAKVAVAQNCYKAAMAVVDYKLSGKFGFTAPKSARAESTRRRMREYVAEVCRTVGV